ncbi:error-prone DNA polymerase [Pararobbsia silviterrae]|uniref:Error-prone DNA polymerase n=1 Tax=Pararobbsia silviterrae TaxID=1792498 RepID=A0A494YA82_9BURK|nr:error-prone DNA polymerase [Pararobbsia silviterrae]RKP57535.1 error-prone DNA polymerase [Pararobbsia silviterrae]
MQYAELHCLSNYSFLRGASHPHELVERAAQLGYTALALTDECSFAGIVRAHLAAREHGIALLIGSELRLVDAAGRSACTLVALATNRNGYGNLSELITCARTRTEKGRYWLECGDLTAPPDAYAHLAGLPDCVLMLVPSPEDSADDVLARARWLAGWAAGRCWLAFEAAQSGDDAMRLQTLRTISTLSGVPLVAAGGVLMHAGARKRLQDTLTAIRLNTPLSACGFALEANAQRHLRPLDQLAELYPPDLLAATQTIAACCRFSLDTLRYEYPDELVPPGKTPAEHLRELVMAGSRVRWPDGLTPKHIEQIEHELTLVAELGYEPYFLTVHEIVAFARDRKILCQGRGSAANSVICFCLGITEIDPVRMSMLVERFISRARKEPPDIDVDFEHQRREEVIQHIYEKYGRHRAALAASLASYRTRSALRDVGKALGFDAQLVERIAQAHQWWDGTAAVPERLAEAGFDPASPLTRHLVELVQALRGFPRHLSQHVGGFVIARDKLSRLVPIENAAMEERNVIQWDKDDIEALGLLKMDVLALGMLSAIRRALELVAVRRGLPEFKPQDIPAEDLDVYEMCSHADTIGVFQIESRAQQGMLPRLRPQTYYDLVVEVAIVRPGPIQGGMVHPYLRRRQGLEPVVYPKEEVKPALERTLGVPVFQEQVMHLSMLAAGFSAEKADALRRAMAAWKRKGHLDQYQDELRQGMLDRGYDPAFAERICKQIEGFGDYGFPESHAASFALLCYQSAWLKRHEPAAFLIALLNSQPLGFYSPSQLVQDARRHGVTVLPPDVTMSDWEARFEYPDDEQARERARRAAFAATRHGPAPDFDWRPAAPTPFPMPMADRLPRRSARRYWQLARRFGAHGPAARLGLNLVKGFSQAAAERIMAARRRAPFENVDDLARRAALSRLELEALAAGDALQALAGHRRQAWWAVTAQQGTTRLLRDAPIDEAPLMLPRAKEGREIIDDYASLGLTLKRHPVALLRTHLAALRFRTAEELTTYPNGRLARACGIVTVRQRPDTASGTIFISIEDETGSVNVIVWPRLIERYRKEVLGAQLLGVFGTWQREGEVVNLVAQRLVDHSALLGELATHSRDFH